MTKNKANLISLALAIPVTCVTVTVLSWAGEIKKNADIISTNSKIISENFSDVTSDVNDGIMPAVNKISDSKLVALQAIISKNPSSTWQLIKTAFTAIKAFKSN